MFAHLIILNLGALAGFLIPVPGVDAQAVPKLIPGTRGPAANTDMNFPASAYMGKGIDMTSVFPVDLEAVSAHTSGWKRKAGPLKLKY